MPGARLANWLRGGAARRVEKVRNAVSLTTWMAPALTSEIAYRWIADGTAARLVDWHRAEAQARQAGVVVIPSARFAVGRTKPEEAVRICLGSPDPRELAEAGPKRLTRLHVQAAAPVPAPEPPRLVF